MYRRNTVQTRDRLDLLLLAEDVGVDAKRRSRLFEVLAEFFDVDPAFLAGDRDAAVPEKVAAQLDLVRSMRHAKVRSYAARTLGDLSPETLHAISRLLDEQVAPT